MTKCGYVSVVGRPNAGKSSLLNWLVGEKIAMVSHKANATRRRSNIIVMHEEDQIVFVDTPGIHETEKLLNQFMLDEALKAMGDCDLILFLAPVTDSLKYYEDFLEKNKKNTKHILQLMLKLKEYEKYSDKYEAMIPISIKKATKKSDILDVVVKYLPEHPYLFDPEIMTTEQPYEADVMINKIEEKPNVDVIRATIIVQKDSQKGMIIGQQATAIKRIGKAARIKIEKLSGKKCFLELFVSVKKNWTKNKDALKSMGYDIDI